MLCRSRLCGVLRRRLGRSCRVGVRQRLVAGTSGAKCATMREEIGPGYRFHLRAPRFGGLEAAKARRPSVGGETHLAQDHLAQDMHAVERIAAAMDVAGASIILGRQCRFSASGTSRPIAIISRSHSASIG
jgi:hypothetical protein